MGLFNSLFGRKKNPKSDMSPELNAVMKKMALFMEDENYQNSLMDEVLRDKLINGLAVDVLPHGIGEFGRTPENPIPVNGFIGEFIYLSRLATKDTHQKILFHRIGSVECVDAYETVSIDGRTWDILFFSMYHPRKSRKAPEGYELVSIQKQPLIYGTNRRLAQFPLGVYKAISDDTEKLLGMSLPPSEVRIAEEKVQFQRPEEHKRRIQMVYQGVEGWLR